MPNVNIKATHTTLTQSMSDYIAKKLEAFGKFLREENNIHVEFDVDKHRSGLRYRAEITIMPKSEIYAEAYGSDLYEAIDLCIPKIKEQLTKNKDKEVSLRKRLGSKRKSS